MMTTNHRENLDPALIRPGRIDMQIKLDNCTPDMARKFFLRFFPGQTAQADAFRDGFPDREEVPISPARLQGYFLRFKPDGVASTEQKAARARPLGRCWQYKRVLEYLSRYGTR